MSLKRNNPNNHRSPSQTKDNRPEFLNLEDFSFLREEIKFDSNIGDLQAANADWLIVQANLIRSLFEGLRIFLRQNANAAIKAAGKNTGRSFIDNLLERDMQLEEADGILNILVGQGGWVSQKPNMTLKQKKRH